MKKSLITTTLTALLALTACNSSIEATSEPNIEPVEDPGFKVAAESDTWPLEPDPDGHEIHFYFEWVPDVEDPQPVDGRYYMRTSEADNSGMAYVTPVTGDDVVPSVDSGMYERFVYSIPDGGNATGRVFASEAIDQGYVACLAVEVKQQVVLDYQESQPGDDVVDCLAFTDDNHELHDHIGSPPPGFVFDFDPVLDD